MRTRENFHTPTGGPSSSHANYDVFARSGETISSEGSSRGSVTKKDFTKALLELQQNPGKKIKVNSVSDTGNEFVCVISFDNFFSVDVNENGEFRETLEYSTIKDLMVDFGKDTFLHISTTSFGKKRKETREHRKQRFIKSMGGRARLTQLRREQRRLKREKYPPQLNNSFGKSLSSDIKYLST